MANHFLEDTHDQSIIIKQICTCILMNGVPLLESGYLGTTNDAVSNHISLLYDRVIVLTGSYCFQGAKVIEVVKCNL